LIDLTAYADHSLLPPGKYMTMFQYLEYPASRGKIHIVSANPYKEPYFDSGFMNNRADFAPIRWSYKKTREVARRMDGMFYIGFSPSRTTNGRHSIPWRAYFTSSPFPPGITRSCEGH
jgi:hypothetical protein